MLTNGSTAMELCGTAGGAGFAGAAATGAGAVASRTAGAPN
jgi:hypothetical protein